LLSLPLDRVALSVATLGFLGVVASGVAAWKAQGPYGDLGRNRTGWQSVAPATGQAVVAFNSRGYGKPDVWCYMDGDRVVRVEFDADGDAVIDEWEYYAADGSLERAYERDESGCRRLASGSTADKAAKVRFP
jgi:hypothetical protein